MQKEKKTRFISFKTTKTIELALQKAAHNEDRSMSNIIERSIKNYLKIQEL
jgi:hypothetical protein